MSASTMRAGPEMLESLILDLSLASALPMGMTGTSSVQATASVQTLAYLTEAMEPKELRELVYTVGPLLALLSNDVDSPIAAKAAFGIRNLMPSRGCLNYLVEIGGLVTIGRIFDQLLGHVDMKQVSHHKSIVEFLAIVYREASRFFHYEVVYVGAIRHCVRMLQYGDWTIKATAAMTLASLSDKLDIVKQMFSNGAIKPILNVCDIHDSNAACLLAGLGCIIQFARIPEIGAKVVRQGALPLLEKAFHLMEGLSNTSIREKALLGLAWLSRIESVRAQLASPEVLRGMKRDLYEGKPLPQTTVLQMMINLKKSYAGEAAFNLEVRDKLIELLRTGPWHARNLVTKAICLLYRDPVNQMYCVEHGVLEAIFELITAKSLDLQEVPIVALVGFCTHPDIPVIFMNKGGLEILAKVLYTVDEVIRSLAVVLLKALCLYDKPRVHEAIPHEKMHLMDQKDADPTMYGSEYGGMIQDYLQTILKNRRDAKYLLDQFEEGEKEAIGFSEAEFESFQATFMLLDVACIGTLAIDEIKVLMVIMGERLDEEELQLLFDEFDEDKSGELDFKEFCTMMKSWNTRFGKGAEKMVNETFQRGAIGKGRRAFNNWWNREAIEKAEIEKVKKAKEKEKLARQAQMEKHMGHEKIRLQRELEKKLNDQKIAKNAAESLPPV